VADYSRLPGAVHDRWQWQEFGACRAQPTTVFFHPEAERGPRRSRRDAVAKAVCHQCPVIAECRRYALHAPEPTGSGVGFRQRSGKTCCVHAAGRNPGRQQPNSGTQLDVDSTY